MNIELYPHNQETYSKIQEMWKTVNRVAAVQATGTGKSFLILRCLFDIPNKNKVVLAPTEYIFDQLVNNTKEVIPNVEFITYSKLTFMTDEEIQALNPSLIVLDEFHRCGAEQWGKGVQKLLDSFPNSNVLGTSATPIRYLDNERDMSNEIFEGNMAVNLSLAEAIVKGILPMPKYISALYTFEEEAKNLIHKVINSKNTEEEKEDLIKQIEVMKNKLNKSKGIPKILHKHLDQTKSNGKFIVFCKNKEHLNEMKDVVVKWFKKAKINNKIESYIVYTGYENTDIEFQNFRDNKNENTLKLLFSIEMLNEGIHVEDITGVILLRPTISPIIYYQQIGRAIDAGSKKEPLIFDFVNNFDNIGAKKFISDLKEIKEREIDKDENGENDKKDISEFVVYDEILIVKDLFDNIERRLTDNWNAMYKELKQYFIENGDINITKRNNKLGLWIGTQRQAYKKKMLTAEKINKLNEINFIWDYHSDNWDAMYCSLVNYYNDNGHINIPRNNNNNKKLSTWIHSQRERYNNDKITTEQIQKLEKLNIIWNTYDEAWENYFVLYKNSLNCLTQNIQVWASKQRRDFKNNKLSKDKINKLNEVGFLWNPIDEKWDKMFKCLIKYQNIHNNLDVPLKYIIEKKDLGLWIRKQRKDFNNNSLTTEKIKKLNSIGFDFTINYEPKKSWDSYYEEYVNYVKLNNNAYVFYTDNKELSQWVSSQRSNKNTLSKEKIEKLNKIGMIWENKYPTWNKMFEQLKEFYIKNKHSNVAQGDKNFKELGTWVNNQRSLFKKNKLDDYKLNLLKTVKFNFNPYKDLWYEMYEKLIKYKEKYGTSLISQGDKSFDKELYNWIGHQRKDYKLNKLSNEKIEKLKKIDFVFDPILYNWEYKFNLIKEYYNQNGNIKIPKNYIFNNENLTNWIMIQRNRYKKGLIAQDEIVKLESLGMQWEVFDENWDNFYNELVKYKNQYFNVLVPKRYVTENDCKLGLWVSNQRKSFKQNKITDEKIKKLNNIGFIWEIKKTQTR